jgi:hypothetical protein
LQGRLCKVGLLNHSNCLGQAQSSAFHVAKRNV